MTESFIAALRIVFRNRQNVFWGFAFPLFFVLAFSLFKTGTQADVRTRILAPESGEAARIARQLEETLKESSSFDVRSPDGDDSEAALEAQIKADKLDLVVWVEGLPQDSPSAVSIRALYDEADVLKKEVTFATISSFVDKTNLQAAGIEQGFALASFTPVVSKTVNFFDFTLAGFIGYGVASISVIGISSAMVGYRDRKILKRLACTPVDPRRFVLAHVAARLVLSGIQAVVIIGVARLLGAHIYGNPAWAVGFVVVSNLIFLNLGLALGGAIRGGPEVASAAGTAITLPMFIVSGAFFSLSTLPVPLRLAARILPLSPVVDGTRKILLEGFTLSGLVPNLAIVAAWILVSAVLAVSGSRRLLGYE